MTNDEIIAKLAKMESILKAETVVSDGLMNEEQAKTFIQEVAEESEFLSMIDLQQMLRPKKKIYTIGLDDRVLRKGVKDTEPTAVEYDMGERELDVVETILPVNIHFDDIEDSIEGDNFEQTINDIFVRQFSNDLADLAINGKEDSGDDFLEINDGYLEIADTDSNIHALPFGSNDSPKAIFNAMLAALPNKWKNNKKELAYMVSPTVQQNYIDEIGERVTVLGDRAIVDEWTPTYNGIPVKSVVHMPDSRVLLSKPNNLKFGWYKRYLRVGRWVNERKRRIEYTITTRTDQEYALSDLIVLATNPG